MVHYPPAFRRTGFISARESHLWVPPTPPTAGPSQSIRLENSRNNRCRGIGSCRAKSEESLISLGYLLERVIGFEPTTLCLAIVRSRYFCVQSISNDIQYAQRYKGFFNLEMSGSTYTC